MKNFILLFLFLSFSLKITATQIPFKGIEGSDLNIKFFKDTGSISGKSLSIKSLQSFDSFDYLLEDFQDSDYAQYHEGESRFYHLEQAKDLNLTNFLFNLFRVNDNQVLIQDTKSDEEYLLPLKGILTQNSKLDISRLFIRYLPTRPIFISARKITTQSDEDTVEVSSLELNCSNLAATQNNLIMNALKSCSKRGTTKLAKIILNGAKEQIKIEKLNFDITNNKYNLKFKVPSVSPLNITIRGTTELKESEKLLILFVRSARLGGLLSVKDMLFDEIMKQQSKNLQVLGDFIYIRL